jgi:hypothetical protein
MRKLLIGLALMIGFGLATAAELGTSDQQAIRTAIEGQIEAFKRDDGDAAFSYASPRIQAIFKDPETFLGMVRKDYAPVYRPRLVSFRDLETIAGNLIQPVLVVGPSGVPVTALYIMERQKDGAWRIGGCVLVAEPDKGI